MVLLISLLVSAGNIFGAADTGRSAAAKYFAKDIKPLNVDDQQALRRPAQAQTGMRGGSRLGFFAGTFLQKRSLGETAEGISGWSVRFDYQREAQSGDFLTKGYQLVLQKFQAAQTELSNLTFFWSFRFPREVVFPAYIGVAFGPGVFLRQLQDESWLSADIKGFVGLRLDGTYSKFYVEGGVQNQYLVLSSGQYQGWFVSSGVAYTF